MLWPSKPVEVFEPDRLQLVRTTPPALSENERQARDRAWDQGVRANPELYDGLAVACVNVEYHPEESTLTMMWAPVRYRYFLARQVPGAVVAPCVFAAVVQPTVDGGLLVGRTSAAGRVQIPGGVAELLLMSSARWTRCGWRVRRHESWRRRQVCLLLQKISRFLRSHAPPAAMSVSFFVRPRFQRRLSVIGSPLLNQLNVPPAHCQNSTMSRPSVR